ncbi:Uncharacterised protein [uncultured archaeon]|nr:Uncharacterised protein [uncultured archaeon]
MRGSLLPLTFDPHYDQCIRALALGGQSMLYRSHLMNPGYPCFFDTLTMLFGFVSRGEYRCYPFLYRNIT